MIDRGRGKPPLNDPEKTRVLLLAANPPGTDRLRLDLELREVAAGLERAVLGGRFELRLLLAARPEDVRRAMLDLRPHIVHFSGHGEGADGLVFEDSAGQPRPMTTQALANFFKLFAGQVRCVLLNACYSQVQAEAIAQHVDYVVGMNRAIGDASAIAFATGFYDALGVGEPVPRAFDLGRSAIEMAGLPGADTPVLKIGPRLQPPYCPWAMQDVYVSFAAAAADPADPGGAEAVESRLAWIDDLTRCLRSALLKELKSDACALWLDYGAREDAPIAESTLERLGAAAAILVVLSPDYTASERCRAELRCFLDSAGDPGRVFVAALADSLPPAPLLGAPDAARMVPFWGAREGGGTAPLAPGLDHNRQVAYYQRVADLARAMAPALVRLRTGPASVASADRSSLPATAPGPSPAAASRLAQAQARSPDPGAECASAVYLADAPDDLVEPREDLRRFLEQQGYGVMPTQVHYHPGDPARLAAAVDTDLGACALFVQVLGATVAVRPEGLVTPVIQLERARALGLPLLQWRSPELEPAQVQNPAQRAALLAPEVVASPLESFKQQLLRRLARPPTQPAPAAASGAGRDDGRLVFVNASRDDRDLARQLSSLIGSRHGLLYAIPLDQGAPEQIREDLEGNLRDADAILLLYGQSPCTWVREQLRRAVKATRTRPDRPFVALCEIPPPASKEPLDMQIPDWIRVHRADPAHLEELLAPILAGIDAAGIDAAGVRAGEGRAR
jgi:hypothetical protein